MTSTEDRSVLWTASYVSGPAIISSATILLPAGPIVGFAIAAPFTLLLLGISFGLTWVWHRLIGTPQKSFRRNWIFVKSVVLAFGVVFWCVASLLPIFSTWPDHEFSPTAHLRTINTAQVTYQSGLGKYGTIQELITLGLLDARYASPISGYVFDVSVSASDYTATALPLSVSAGRYGYYSSSDAVVRYAQTTTETCKPCYPNELSGTPVQ